MLNISNNSDSNKINKNDYQSLRYFEEKKIKGNIVYKIFFILALVLVVLILPWTQNIPSLGTVTTLRPEQKPQKVHSVIGGQIEKWYVLEGDYVQKGDTILHISETKSEYFDPELVDRTWDQIQSVEQSVGSYEDKVNALDLQIEALRENKRQKLLQGKNKVEQLNLKIKSDSLDLEAKSLNRNIAQQQYERTSKLHADGLKSLTDLESKRQSMQKSKTEEIASANKLLSSRNELINAEIELNAIESSFKNSIAKAESDKYTAQSNMFDAEIKLSKMKGQHVNYKLRNDLYYVTSPQSGHITKILPSGIGETVKEGESIATIMPEDFQLAIEMFVKPMDLPLLAKGQTVRIRFDGWPAIFFSGWPNTSYGTYGGRIFAIDNFISANGKYRVLVSPDVNDKEWPDALKVGTGTHNIVLLNDVKIWYELWRLSNGFPADYYQPATSTTDGKSK
ncbi:HlyD family secretion protein [Aureibacter tunicatorum]|uniref:Multidrug resistance efflux pump n=1 Tax=Aureibacter tunicatorum TaxID=866807 RepID=A0AAE4BRT2_9BACT|nr:HlyD family efflux transporter periplasmic adaptor subunit [Aureibacter tunicatorum]MDR6240519.1 multidrug resistance efflux pump [Aureibacter tunicatorum]BDD06620.1 biotin attachment protein [Aureibacter tunicatorum]